MKSLYLFKLELDRLGVEVGDLFGHPLPDLEGFGLASA